MGDAVTVQMTEREREVVRHALGLDRTRESYRNYYVGAYGSADLLVCLAMVGKGWLAEVSDAHGLMTFSVTDAGIELFARTESEG